MKSYQRSFIELALQAEVLKFGEFTLKSGRISPYFFNAGKFQTGRALAELGRYYAEALLHSGAEFDMVFGPAYKGIPLVSSLSIALADQHQRDLPYGYNRKEAKDHGEGGTLVGAPLAGKVAIVDDVITAGTAIRQVLELIKVAGARPAVIVVGLDRQERGQGDLSAIQEIERDTGIPVVSIVKLNDIIRFLQSRGDEQQLEAIVAYREKYGISEDT